MDGAFLRFSRDGQQHTVALPTGPFALGRADGNDLSFPQDHAISSRHAVIEQQANDWLIRDLNSTNGTYVNGNEISGEQVLGSGDSIQLGQTQLAFHVAAAGQDAVATAPPGRYLDVTEEWEGAAAPGPAQPTRQPQAQAARQPLPQAWPGPGQPSLDSYARPAAERDVRIPAPKVSPPPPQQAERGHGQVRGTARSVLVRKDQNDRDVLSFRIERYDSVGNRLPPVGAEFAGYQAGQLGDGDEVEASGRWSHGTLRATKVTNLSTGAQVRGMSGFSKVVLAIFFALICAFILGIALSVVFAG